MAGRKRGWLGMAIAAGSGALALGLCAALLFGSMRARALDPAQALQAAVVVVKDLPPLGPEPAPLALEVVKINDRHVYRYQSPPSPRGVIYLFHGGGGQSADWLKRTEGRQLMARAVARGFGVVAMDSTKTPEGGWARPTESRADLDRIAWVRADLAQRGVFAETLPRYGVGASSGGKFVCFAGVDQGFDAIAVLAQVPFADPLIAAEAAPDVLFVIGEHDPKNPLAKVVGASEKLVARGIESQVAVLEASPLSPELVARVEGLDASAGADIVRRLRDGGVIGSDGSVPANLKYPSGVLGPYKSFKPNLIEPLEIAAGGHAFDRKHVPLILDFFERASASR